MKRIKKFVAMLQIVFLLGAMLPLTVFDAPEVNAAVSGITNGGHYMIVSAYNGKAITQTSLSTFYANCVVWNTNAASDLARWTVSETGSHYRFTNPVSGKSMKICGNSAGSTCDFNGFDNSNNYKWTLEPITSGTYAGCFYIASSVKASDGQTLYAEITDDAATKDNDGAQVRLYTKGNSEPRQIWRFVESPLQDTEFTEDMAMTMVNAFKNKYFEYNSETGYNSLGQGFWGIAEVMEAMLDGYETTGRPVYREMFEGTYNDFISRNGTNWSWNGYNDDITWAAIVSVRAYMLFGNTTYLNIAKENFNLMYDRAITYGYGMLRWCEESDKRGSTNSCINGPAMVCACYLGIATGDESYFTKARDVYAAWRQHLFVSEGANAGWAYDSINMSDGSKNTWCSTYNQGTTLGAASMLYQHYGDEMYYNDACNIMKYTLDHLCYNNILKDENTNSGDLSGFRGILMRYMRKFIVDFEKDEYLSFFKDNALVAWMNRNSSNLQQNPWQNKTPENVTWDEFAAYNSISLITNIPTYSDSIFRDAYNTIEAEDMDYCKGLISENSNGTSGGRSLGGVQNGHYTVYNNVDFGDLGATQVTFRYSKARESDSPNSYIEIRLGSTTGTVIGTANLTNTGTWSDWSTVTADITRTYGVQDIYLLYKTNTSYVCNLDSMTFTEYVEPIVPKPAFESIEAEDFDEQSGLATNTNPGYVGDINSSDWAQYDHVEFNKTANSVIFKYSAPASAASGTVKLYVGSMSGTPVCTAYLAPINTTSWTDSKSLKFDLNTPISAGSYTLYIVFEADNGKANVCDLDSFVFSTIGTVTYSDDVKIEGYQLSTAVEGTRVIGSVEPTINGTAVEKWGLIYGLASANGINNNIADSDMVINSNHQYVVNYDSTPAGTSPAVMGDSKTATYFVRTMTYGGKTADAYNATYKVRAYAVLSDGSIVYGDVSNYSVYRISHALYQNKLMSSEAGHNYLYNTILKVVDPNYAVVDYTWDNTIIAPNF